MSSYVNRRFDNSNTLEVRLGNLPSVKKRDSYYLVILNWRSSRNSIGSTIHLTQNRWRRWGAPHRMHLDVLAYQTMSVLALNRLIPQYKYLLFRLFFNIQLCSYCFNLPANFERWYAIFSLFLFFPSGWSWSFCSPLSECNQTHPPCQR